MYSSLGNHAWRLIFSRSLFSSHWLILAGAPLTFCQQNVTVGRFHSSSESSLAPLRLHFQTHASESLQLNIALALSLPIITSGCVTIMGGTTVALWKVHRVPGGSDTRERGQRSTRTHEVAQCLLLLVLTLKHFHSPINTANCCSQTFPRALPIGRPAFVSSLTFRLCQSFNASPTKEKALASQQQSPDTIYTPSRTSAQDLLHFKTTHRPPLRPELIWNPRPPNPLFITYTTIMHLLPLLTTAITLLNPVSAGTVDSTSDNIMARRPAECDTNYCQNYYGVCYKQKCDPRDFHQVDCRRPAKEECICKTAKQKWVSDVFQLGGVLQVPAEGSFANVW